jgi:hypothetical protein
MANVRSSALTASASASLSFTSRCAPPARLAGAFCREDGDRRFYSELVEGLRPSGDCQLTNQHPPPALPLDTYDVGDGYLAHDGKVYSYDGSTVLRDVGGKDEEAWAKKMCRRGPDPTSY